MKIELLICFNNAFIFQVFESKINFCLTFTSETLWLSSLSTMSFTGLLYNRFQCLHFSTSIFWHAKQILDRNTPLNHNFMSLYANVHKFKTSCQLAVIGVFRFVLLISHVQRWMWKCINTDNAAIKLGMFCWKWWHR